MATQTSKKIYRHKGRVVFQFPFSYETKDKVKFLFGEFGGIEYNKIKALPNTWSLISSLIDTKEKINKLFSFAESESFEIEPELAELLTSQNKDLATLKVLSSSEQSDFNVDGLILPLRPYQKSGVEYMVKTKRCVNADTMRLGKTLQTLAAIHYQKAYPVLIVCKAGLMYNWQNEIKKSLGNTNTFVCDKVKGGVPSGFDFVTINPEKLTKLKSELLSYGFNSIVYDEAHNIGNKDTLKFRTLVEISEPINVRYALTGTPIRNRALEITNILEFLGRLKEFGGRWRFINEFYDVSDNGFGIQLGNAKNLEVLHEKLRSRCMVRRTKQDVLKEIPIKDFIAVEVPISNSSDCEKLTSEIRILQNKSKKNIEYKKEVRGKIFELRKLVGIGKVEAIVEWAEDFLTSGEPLVLFAHHIEVQNKLLEVFPKASRILGTEINLKVRRQNQEDFQSGKTNIIICSLLAAGEGVDLSRANTIGICELGWTPVQLEQALARIEAVGKLDATSVYTFMGRETIDMKMADMLQTKGVEGDMVVSGKENEDSYVESLLEF
jgi:SWI/SNF-related matrix-associated actin-dependent regulator 1 of chromatin subfamily A